MKTILIIFITGLVVFIFDLSAVGQMVNISEATKIANNWIDVIVDEKGSWGEYKTAEIEPLQEFKQKDRKLGYFCNVNPEGYIILSVRRELAPVKAYSPRGYFDPESEFVGNDIIKTSMGLIVDTIESRLGLIESVNQDDLANILEINYTDAWVAIYNYTPGTWYKDPSNKSSKGDYQAGDIMLDGNNWHQFPPYNNDCPYMGCTTTSNGRALVGCVATAGIQIMRHWAWPPYGVSPYNDSYDWPNMPDVVSNSSPQVEIDAVAELGYEVAVAVNMNFGCDGSGASITNMEGVFENYFRYSTNCNVVWRSSYSSGIDWFEALKGQLALNRPVEYGIIGHAIVCDGWKETGSPVLREYHMNGGWVATSNDTWYTLDALPGGGIDIEHFVGNIVPNCALGSWIYGYYPTTSPNYRYFDRDAIGYAATFQYGQLLQFLPEVVVTGMSPTEPIVFDGSDFLNLRMFTGGDLSNGIRIYDASIELTNFGSIKFYDE